MNETSIKIGVGLVIIGLTYAYIISLHHTNETQSLKILALDAQIQLQNVATDAAKKEKDHIDKELIDVTKENKRLAVVLKSAKDVIDSRPRAVSCEAAVTYLSNTAADVANKWNTKQ